MATSARSTVRAFYRRNGYVKIKPASADSHPSIEMRVSVSPGADLRRLRAALKALGIKPGRPFAKGKMLRVPIYGEKRVEALARVVGARLRASRPTSSRSSRSPAG